MPCHGPGDSQADETNAGMTSDECGAEQGGWQGQDLYAEDQDHLVSES